MAAAISCRSAAAEIGVDGESSLAAGRNRFDHGGGAGGAIAARKHAREIGRHRRLVDGDMAPFVGPQVRFVKHARIDVLAYGHQDRVGPDKTKGILDRLWAPPPALVGLAQGHALGRNANRPSLLEGHTSTGAERKIELDALLLALVDFMRGGRHFRLWCAGTLW